ncbi:MAG: hypothetical protein WB660_29550 [Candidatus Sulfotelmatobacter sp.]
MMGPAIGKGFHGMARVGWNDCDYASSRHLPYPVDSPLKFALNHLINFFLRMEVLLNGCTPSELVMGEHHARRMEIASIPAWQPLNHSQIAGIYKGHICSGAQQVILAGSRAKRASRW